MAYFVATYSLARKGKFDYQGLWGEFKRIKAQKYQESCWFLDLDMTVGQVLATLKQYVHEDDMLMVIEFSKAPAWNKAIQGTNQWLSARFP